MKNYGMLIDGEWISNDEVFNIENPANGDFIATVPVASESDVERSLQSARKAQIAWAKLTGVARGDVLRKWGDKVLENKERLARTITIEQGKPISDALGEVESVAKFFFYFAGFDRRIEGEILASDNPDEQIWIIPQPIGVVVGIIPWNYPASIAARKAAPALIAGNSIVLKPTSDTPLCILELAELAMEAGMPPGVLNVVTGPGSTVGESLVKNKIPGLITMTGSTPAGKRIIKTASETVKMVSLELGGKAPFIVMEDADIDKAVEVAVGARFGNCGQLCIANERTYVHEKIYDEFVEKLIVKVNELKIGDPLQPDTTFGPKVNRQEVENVEAFVAEAINDGAQAAIGGKRLTKGMFSKGYWFEPTVLVNVRQDMRIMHDEVFGPVLPVMKFSSFEEGLKLANDSKFGLAAFLFSKDMNRIMRAVRDIECGELYINRGPGESVHGFHTGWKESGIGGDDGENGFDLFLQKKTVYVKFGGEE